MKTHPLLEFRNVSVVIRERKILDAVSFAIHEGENVAVIGPNGSGKSTLIRTIMRERYPLAEDGAYLRIFGDDSWDVFDLRLKLGIVSNELQSSCTRDITARELVLSGFFSSIGLFSNHRVLPEMERKAGEVMAFLEISHLSGRLLTEMSSGEARRVLIARALVHDPKALLLDEPLNSLDLHAAYAFKNIIRKIAAAGTSIIMVTHAPHDIIPEISRIILLRDGRVFRDDAKEKILTADVLSKFFAIPVDIREKDGYYHVW